MLPPLRGLSLSLSQSRSRCSRTSPRIDPKLSQGFERAYQLNWSGVLAKGDATTAI
jgi:hypothetical protein